MTHAPAQADRPGTTLALPAPPEETASSLPRWPVTALFVGFPAWWALGVVDFVAVLLAGPMLLLLATARGARSPRGFGLWLVFLGWAAASVMMVTTGGDMLAFVYRLALYAAGGVLLLYVYNARRTLGVRYVTGCLTALWVTTVAGGFAGLAFPTAVVNTPLSYLLPESLLANDLVNHMAIRRLTQYNPDSFLQVAPRPSAPFLYTNNWGNAYSLLLPFVVVYLLEVRRERRFRWLVALLVASAVPALLTLNRGMFLGIGIALAYIVLRLLLLGRFKPVLGLVGLGLVAVALFQALPVEQRLGERLSESAESTSNDTRIGLYLQAVELVPESPVLGFGVPQESDTESEAPVGTQGQLWMVLVSHGPIATACFVGFFVLTFLRTARRRDRIGLASGTVLLVGTVELAYYGILPYGLPILMVAAAMGLRGRDAVPSSRRSSERTSYDAVPSSTGR